jgi:hypothetical protein
MEFPKEFILTSYNLFAWKEKMIVHLRSRRLCRLTMNTQTKPTLTIEKSKYMNQMDEHLELFAVLFLLKSSFPYPLVQPPMNPRPPWKKFVDTERGVNQYQVQFKNFFNLYLNHSIISNETMNNSIRVTPIHHNTPCTIYEK